MNFSTFIKNIKNNPKIKKAKYLCLTKITENKPIVDMAMAFSRSISGFAETKSPLSFIEGGVGVINSLTNLLGGFAEDYLSHENGWTVLCYKSNGGMLWDIINSIVNDFPKTHLTFIHDKNGVLIYEVPVGLIGITKTVIFFNHLKCSREELLEFVIKEKLKSFNSQFFSIHEQFIHNENEVRIKYDLIGEDLLNYHSEFSRKKAAEIKAYLEKGLPRSMIFDGPPGTGKTSAAQSIIQQLNLRTLKFNYKIGMDLTVIIFIIKIFNVEAVILDDFSHFNDSVNLLSFLEWLHRNVKVIIATTNSLRPLHPAIIRPQRIDEIINIHSLDENVIIGVLGEELYKKIGKRVAKWPIAYIVEIKNRITAIPDLDIENSINELGSRVKSQLLSIKE